MTREAIEYFKFHRKIFCEDHLKICPKDSIAYQATLKEKEFYDMAIKALEQEPVLDKIRAEIKSKIVKRPWLDFEDRERDRNDAFLEALDVIDEYKKEYKAESEEE